MSKKLNKLVDINGLREFKNKLVGTDSAYVQTTAVDQTIAGTKTFSKPIVGSVTGSSGSCTGNAATATKLQTARTINGTNFDGSGNITTANWGTARNVSIQDHNAGHTGSAVSVNGSGNVTLKLPSTINANVVGYLTGNISGNCSGTAGSVAWNNVSGKPSAFTPYFANGTWYSVGDDVAIGDHNVGGGLGVIALNNTTTRIDFCYKDNAANYKSITYDGTTLYMNGNCDYATNSGYTNWLRTSSHSDHLLHTEWDGAYFWTYVTAGDGGYRAVRVERSDSAATATKATQDSDGNQINTTYSKNGHTHNSVRTPNNRNTITFDWSSQVSGCVGITVDATKMGGIITTANATSLLVSLRPAAYDVGSTIYARTDSPAEYGATVAGSQLKYAAMDSGDDIHDPNRQLTTAGTWLKVSGNSGNTGGSGLYRRIA